jgi:glycosyltransferase involved in cell wall biosynthesis
MSAKGTGKASDRARPLVVLAANDCWGIVNYRKGLITALRDAGVAVAVFAPEGPYSAAVRGLGIEFYHVPMAPRGKSPRRDLNSLIAYLKQLRAVRPDAFLGFTSKPNIYGSLAAHALGIPVLNNISGLGAVFARQSLLTRLVSLLYKAALRRSATVFFQNRDDLALFQRLGLVKASQCVLLPGSGVGLAHFAPRKKNVGRPFTFLFSARLLWDKGVAEFVEAARQVRSRHGQVRFQILGIIEPQSREAVSEAQLGEWEKEGVISFLGAADDVRDAFAGADCIALPSYYREGVPRVLLEASAMGIPVITTDAPGCREAVDDQVTGFLCEPRSVASLVAAIERMLALPTTKRRAMGTAARAKMEREFREDIVHRAYLEALAKLGVQDVRN